MSSFQKPHEEGAITLACHAMATRFELVLYGEDPVRLRAAGEEALDEIKRIESQLNVHDPASEASYLNSRAGREPVRVDPRLFALLRQAQELSAQSDGAFDLTIGPLMRAWGFGGGPGRMPPPAELEEARSRVGMSLLLLDEASFTVKFANPGVRLDFGSLGKGYAIEQAAGLLREAGVGSALLHGGSSTVYALGGPPDAPAWKIAVPHPDFAARTAPWAAKRIADPGEDSSLLAVVGLRDTALSLSGTWGKSFESGGKRYGHVMDPRQGRPVQGAELAAVGLSSPTETDALSTALLVLGREGHDSLIKTHKDIRSLLGYRDERTSEWRFEFRGMDPITP